MRRNEQGMTVIGMLILAIILGLIGFAGLKLLPLYLNHYKVVSVLEGVKKEYDGQNPTRTDIRKSIEKRMVVESLDTLEADDIEIKREDPGYVVAAQYEQRTTFIANVSFLVTFDKTVEIAL
ncbi:MAG: DUF4845 domain-containing protein [Gammaproteobacteria bacterium]|nr:DUF4845 domain-containing protein [Gammaproteobacteria bacterium]